MCQGLLPTRGIMEQISRAMSRIRELQSQLNVQPRSGGFQAILDSASAPAAPSAAQTQLPTASLPGFGAMIGPNGVIPVAVGQSTNLDIAAYLETQGVADRNGRLTASELVEVSGGWHGSARLLAPAAQSWESMRSAAAADGVELLAIDTYRSYDTQAHAHEEYLAGRKSAYVAPPGRSEHGYGLAIDVTNGSLVGPGDREWEWLNNNGSKYGWHPISNESWHWEYRG